MKRSGLGSVAAGLSPQSLRDDLSDVARRLARSPSFVVHTTLSLGVAVALCMLAFSFFNAVHLRGLGLRDPGRLVTLGPRFGFSSYDWGVCINPKSHRYGLLTFEHQGCPACEYDHEAAARREAEFERRRAEYPARRTSDV